jgi:hypothetical protein
MEAKRKDLNSCIRALGRLAKSAAETEREYRVELAKAMLKLQAEGKAATIIPDLARGDPFVADLKQKRDFAEAYYKSNIECINAIKTEMRILEGYMKQEWSAE